MVGREGDVGGLTLSLGDGAGELECACGHDEEDGGLPFSVGEDWRLGWHGRWL